MSFEEAALIELTAVAIHTVKKAGQRINDRVVVMGSGTIGLLVTQVAKLAGAEEVITTDLLHHKLKKAEELGADRIINPQCRDVVKSIHKSTGGMESTLYTTVWARKKLSPKLFKLQERASRL